MDAICHHAFADAVDIVVANNCCFSQSILDKYNAMGSTPVVLREKRHPYIVMERDLINTQQQLVRHDSQKVKEVVEEILRMP